MKWIFEHFQIIALIGVAIASWVKHRQDLAQAADDDSQAEEEMEDEEEVIGPGRDRPPVPLPVARPLPKSLVRTKVAPLVVRAGQPPPTAPTGDALILQEQQEIQDRLRQIREAKATTTGGAAATRTRVSAAQRHPQSPHVAKTGLRAALRSRKELRRAIVLREIIGPPLGLR